MTDRNLEEIDPEVAALLAECQELGLDEIIPDGAFEATDDERF